MRQIIWNSIVLRAHFLCTAGRKCMGHRSLKEKPNFLMTYCGIEIRCTHCGESHATLDHILFGCPADNPLAFVGSNESVSGPPPGNRFLLPTLPSDEGMRLCAFLRGDTSKRPYRIEDFRQPLEDDGVLKDISSIGAYQMSHLWLVRFRTQEAKDAVFAAGGLSVKGGCCAIIDPCRKEIKVKIHWVPFHIPSEALRKALSEFGEVMEIRHEEWNVPAFESAVSTTRVARMVLKYGVTAEELPHLSKFHGAPFLWLCPTPRCIKCRAFGHVRGDCIRTYANVTGVTSEDCDDEEDIVDIEEAETTASDNRCKNSAFGEQGSVHL
ncbi:hypothetical protein V5799_026017 [Amblyomma americanum]|uniref:CCHC-type domain-containing protein n=1 Tax=Amblyomma americanum TaxID=6943 RepID=A0AAQ4DJT0_AMBAM